MRLKLIGSLAPALTIALIAILACNIGTPRPQQQPLQEVPPAGDVVPLLTPAIVGELNTEIDAPATAASVAHLMRPAELAVTGDTVYDVESAGTAPESRAPYGDSYQINRLERPFLQNMTYVPDLDLSTYMVGMDKDWVYVTIASVGYDPNNQLGINYGVELDTDHDGFGDYIVWAHPPYPAAWDTTPVQIFHDTNHDTGGLSGEKSDAPLNGDGYDALIFHGGPGDSDPDMAWVRINSGMNGLLQFAFKRSWSGNIFMLGVVADAGLRDPGKLDYVDRMTIEEAGSPIRDNSSYPLKGLYAVDNICRKAYGFKPTGYEPQLCPVEAPPPRTPRPHDTEEPQQPPPPAHCLKSCVPGYIQNPYPDCSCVAEGPY